MFVRLSTSGRLVNLVENVSCSEITVETLLACLTEEAVHLAAHLTRDAECGMTALLRDINRLHETFAIEIAIRCANGEEIFDSTILGGTVL